MGMQCHFNIEDVRSNGYECSTPHYDANTMLIIDANGNTLWAVNCSDNAMDTDCWFDIGQMRPEAMAKLQWLIQQRISFRCS